MHVDWHNLGHMELKSCPTRNMIYVKIIHTESTAKKLWPLILQDQNGSLEYTEGVEIY